MQKRGVLKRFLPIITLLVLMALAYLSFQVSFENGPTGLEIAWTGTNNQLIVPAGQQTTLDLRDYFSSDQQLSFTVTQANLISLRLRGSILAILPAPGFTGERIITVYAYDDSSVLRQRFKIIVIAEGMPATQDVISPEVQTKEKVERFIEDALATQPTVNAIIVLNETVPFAFSASANKQLKQYLLEQRKQQVDHAQDALLSHINEAPGNQVTGAAITEFDLEIVHDYDTINALAVVLTRQGLEKLRNDPAVEQILLDRQFQALRAQSIPLIDADDAWQLQGNNTNITGAGETICIIDTGIDMNHSAFSGKIFPGHDYANNDATPQDDNNHGTHVAGIAAGNDSTKGVAPDAKIMPVKACNSAGSCYGSTILAGIDYCNSNSVTYNISVISGSLGDGGQYTSANCPSLFESALNTSVSLGIIPVFASGNNGYTGGVSYPACSQFAISVGSSSKSDELDSFTSRGGDRLDVLAPGNSITSTIIGSTGTLTGTSMATPHVSGAVLLIQQNQRAQGKPALTPVEMRQILKVTGKYVAGWHRIDVYAAITKLNMNYTINISENSVTNITPPVAKIKFKDSTDFNRFHNCSRLKYNHVEIDSINCPQFNKSAHVMLAGLPGVNAIPLRDGTACSTDICQNVTFANGTLEFDVSGFTNYSGNSTFGIVDFVNTCAVINLSTSLTANLSSNATCLVINASNLVLNCSGFSITSPAQAIDVNAQQNITIQDCMISDNQSSLLLNLTINRSTIRNTTLNVTSPASWLAISGADNYLENLTFETSNGRVLFTGTLAANGSYTITQTLLNITQNNVFLNSTNLSFMNTSARITLFGISFIDPKPTIDIDDDGIFADCTTCQEVSFENNTFVYTVTQFSSHSSNETIVFNVSNASMTKTDTPDPVENDTLLNYTITVRSTGNGTAANVTVIETYPVQTIFASAQPLPSAGNDTFVLGNLTPGTNLTINITLTVSSVLNQTLLNNTARLSFQNETSQVFINTTASAVTTTTNYSGIQPQPPAPSPSPSSGSSGSAGGGGGSEKPKKKEESSPSLATPAQAVPRSSTLQTTRNQQAQQAQAAPSEQALPEKTPEGLSTITETTERERFIKTAKHKTLFAYVFYGLTFSLLVVTTLYWFVLHHRKQKQ